MKVEEAAIAYISRQSLKKVAFEKESKMVPLYQWSTYDKIHLIRDGISKEELESFKKTAELDYDTLAGILNVARATLLNKKGKTKFDATTSEKIFQLADLYSFGNAVFESTEKFNRWMKTENRALGGVKPLSLLDTHYGVEEVRHLIGRIEYGVYS